MKTYKTLVMLALAAGLGLRACGEATCSDATGMRWYYWWNEDMGGMSISLYDSMPAGHLVVPQSIAGGDVVDLDGGFCPYCVYIPSGSIPYLTSVFFPEGLKRIGVQAFGGQALLGNLALPASLEVLGVAAFQDCPGPFSFKGDRPEVEVPEWADGGVWATPFGTYEQASRVTVYFVDGRRGWVNNGTWYGATTKRYPGTELITGVRATQGVYREGVRVTWNPVRGLSGYDVYRTSMTKPTGSSTLVASVGANESKWDDYDAAGDRYSYVVVPKGYERLLGINPFRLDYLERAVGWTADYTDRFADELRPAIRAYGCRLSLSGDAPWISEDVDSQKAARSGRIGDNESSAVELSVVGTGNLDFAWRVSSEANYDELILSVDGSMRMSISGETSWSNATLRITGSGTHVVRWTYQKDVSMSEGEDCGWLRNVSWSGTKQTSTATFDGNGGQIGFSQSAGELGGWYETPWAWRDGYAFLGWFTARTGGENAEDVRVGEAPRTFYARWQYVTPGSCARAAKRLYMGTGVSTATATLTAEWDDWEYGYDSDYPTDHYVVTLRRGQLYTFAVPRGSGWDFGVSLKSDYVEDFSSDDWIETSYGSDDSLEYILVDTTELVSDQADVILYLYGDYVGQRTLFYYAFGDHVPTGLRMKPEALWNGADGKDYAVSAERELKNKQYWFSLEALPGVQYEFSVSGRRGLSIEVQAERSSGTCSDASSTSVPCDEQVTADRSSRVRFHVREPQQVYIRVSAEEMGSFTASAHWTHVSLGSMMADLRKNAFQGQGFGLQTDEEFPWSIEDGAARTTRIDNGGSTSLEMTVSGRGRICFEWRTSSERSYDELKLFIDEEKVDAISGEDGWSAVEKYVAEGGPHVIRWTYQKDGSVSNGSDCGWLRNVRWSRDANETWVDGCMYSYEVTDSGEAMLLDVEVPSYKNSFTIPSSVAGRVVCGVAADFFNGGSKNVTTASLHVHYAGVFYVGARALANTAIRNATCPHGQSFICRDVLRNTPSGWVVNGIGTFGTGGVSRWATGLVSAEKISFVSPDFQGISPGAFENAGLGRVVIDASVRKIGIGAFAGCTGPFVFKGAPPAVYDEAGVEVDPLTCDVGAFGDVIAGDVRQVVCPYDASGWKPGSRWCGLPVVRGEPPLSYRVYFDANGGVCSTVSKTVVFEQSFGELPTPTREMYEFLGWYTERTGGREIEPSSLMGEPSPMTLYAHWERLVAASCAAAATRLTMSSRVQDGWATLVDMSGFDSHVEDAGVYYCRFTLEKGKEYTFAKPHDACGLEIWADVDGDALRTPACDFYNSLDYFVIREDDWLEDAPSSCDVIVVLTGDPGERTRLYWTEGNAAPVGLSLHPEKIAGDCPEADVSVSATRKLVGFSYCFEMWAEPGVRYEMTASVVSQITPTIPDDFWGWGSIDIERQDSEGDRRRVVFSCTEACPVLLRLAQAIPCCGHSESDSEFSVTWRRSLPFSSPELDSFAPALTATAEDFEIDAWSARPWGVDWNRGRLCVRSGMIPGVGSSEFSVDFEGAGQLAFDYRVSCSRTGARLAVTIDGEEVSATGETGWATYERILGLGRHHVTWRYVKTSARGEGDDCARISSLRFDPVYHKLIFNANGGESSVPFKSVAYMAPVGALPSAQWDGHVFAGWYTAKTGGGLVTEETPMNTMTDYTLYAHWEDAAAGSCRGRAIPVWPDSTVRTGGFSLVREFDGRDYTSEGVLFAQVRLRRGRVYTFAKPHDTVEWSVWGRVGWCLPSGACVDGDASVTYCSDDDLDYAFVDLREEKVGRYVNIPNEIVYDIGFRGAAGDRSLLYYVEGDYLPTGVWCHPERLDGSRPDDYWARASGVRTVLDGEYWFEADLVPFVEYSLKASGAWNVSVEVDDPAVACEHTKTSTSDEARFRVSVPQKVRIGIAADSGNSFTAVWTRSVWVPHSIGE